MDVTRMSESAATEGPSRQELLRIYEQTETIGPIEVLMRYGVATLTTEKGRE
jgi:hypothetical protein